MNAESFLTLLVSGSILLSSFCGVYLALRSFETYPKGRLARAFCIWLIWSVTVGVVYICCQLVSDPLRYSLDMSRLFLEFAYLFLVGISGFAVLGATRLLRRRTNNDAEVLSEDFPKLSTAKPTALQRAFFVNLAAIAGFGLAFAAATVFDDFYYGRFYPTKSRPGFTIYD